MYAAGESARNKKKASPYRWSTLHAQDYDRHHHKPMRCQREVGEPTAVCTASGLTYRIEIMHYVSPKTTRKCTSSRISPAEHLWIRVFRFCQILRDIAIYWYSISIQICFGWFRDSRFLKHKRECIQFRIIFEYFGVRGECMTGRWNEPSSKPMWAREWFACGLPKLRGCPYTCIRNLESRRLQAVWWRQSGSLRSLCAALRRHL